MEGSNNQQNGRRANRLFPGQHQINRLSEDIQSQLLVQTGEIQ